MKRRLLALVIVACALPVNAAGQDSPSRARTSDTVLITSGTPIQLIVLDSISSKTATPGTAVRLQVVGDVRVGGAVLVAHGAPAWGTIERATRARRAWRPGSLVLRLDAVTLVNGQRGTLRGSTALRGEPTHAVDQWVGAAMQTMGLVLIALPLAPLQHGKEAVISSGALVGGEIAADVSLPRRTVEALQPAPAVATHQGRAAVTVYHMEPSYRWYVTVWCGEVRLGMLGPRAKFTLRLPAGAYRLATDRALKGPSLVLNVEDGVDVFVAVTSRGDLAVVSPDRGSAQAAFATSAKASLVDLASIDPAQLQSDPLAKSPRPLQPRALAPGRVDVAVGGGGYGISFAGDVPYETSTRPMFAVNAALGLRRHLALQFGLDVAGYKNDTYYRPEEPHNPYQATARIVSPSAGLRYEFRNPAARWRPFLGGGVAGARFTNVERGLRDRCIAPGECRPSAPELFYGTKLTGYLDVGLNVMSDNGWGWRPGIKAYPLKGDDTGAAGSTASPGNEPTAHDYFWHTQVYVALVYRWR